MEATHKNKGQRQPSYMRDTLAHEKKVNRGQTVSSTERPARWAPAGRSPRAQTVFLSSPLTKDQGRDFDNPFFRGRTPPASPGGSSQRSSGPWSPSRTGHSSSRRGRSESPAMINSPTARRSRSEHGDGRGKSQTPRSEGTGRRPQTKAAKGAKRTPRSPMSEGGRRTPESMYSEEDLEYSHGGNKESYPRRATTLGGMPQFMMRDPNGKPPGKHTQGSGGNGGSLPEDSAAEEKYKEKLAYKQMSETLSQPLWPSTSTTGVTARPRVPGGRSRAEAQKMRRLRSVSPAGREGAGDTEGALDYNRRAYTPTPWSSSDPLGVSLDHIPRFMWRTEAWEGKVHDQEKLRTTGSAAGLPPIPHSSSKGEPLSHDPHTPTPMTVATDKMARRGEHPIRGSRAPWRPAGHVGENGRPHHEPQPKTGPTHGKTEAFEGPAAPNGVLASLESGKVVEQEGETEDTTGGAPTEAGSKTDGAGDDQTAFADGMASKAPHESVAVHKTKPKRLRPVKMMKKVAKFVGLAKVYQKSSHTAASN